MNSDVITEEEIIHKLFQQSIGKTGTDLEPYQTKFNDAMYMIFRTRDPIDETEALHAKWKKDHGYEA